jgi:hypothetical protein
MSTPEEMDRLRAELTYTNTAAAHDVKRLYNNHWFRSKNKEKWGHAVEEAKRKVKRTPIFEDEWWYIHTARQYTLFVSFNRTNCRMKSNILSLKTIPWAKPLGFDLYPISRRKLEEALKGCKAWQRRALHWIW